MPSSLTKEFIVCPLACSMLPCPSFRNIGPNHAGHPVHAQAVLCQPFFLGYGGTSK